jgi:hypothetical protein
MERAGVNIFFNRKFQRWVVEFVCRDTDVRELQSRLAELGGENLGIILKIGK